MKSFVAYPTAQNVMAPYDRTTPVEISVAPYDTTGGCLDLRPGNWCFRAPWPMYCHFYLNVEWQDQGNVPGKRGLQGAEIWCGFLRGIPTISANEIQGQSITLAGNGNQGNNVDVSVMLNTGEYVQAVCCCSLGGILVPSLATFPGGIEEYTINQFAGEILDEWPPSPPQQARIATNPQWQNIAHNIFNLQPRWGRNPDGSEIAVVGERRTRR